MTDPQPDPPARAAERAVPEHRQRLLDAMADVVARKGYAAATISDIAAAARVSKRSFYEHFADKAACLLALYELASSRSFEMLRAAVRPDVDWHAQVEQVMAAYLGCLAANPQLLRTLFVEIMALGPAGLAVRRRNAERLAEFIVAVAGPQLPKTLAVAIVGGIHEWVLQAAEDDRVAELPALAGPSARLVRAVVDGAG